jgi:hypothetical protein
MILGMSTATFTLLHVILSLVGILAGIVVVVAMLGSKRFPGWTALFLVTTVLTSVTGFFFPRDQLLPSHVVGVISLVVLAVAIVALYAYRIAGAWRWIYVVSALAALYLNAFVAVAQAFQKIPALAAAAPTQAATPFVATQIALLAIFIALAVAALRSFRPDGSGPALRSA